MKNKEILNKLFKIASNQQKILQKLAQEANEAAIKEAISNFVKYQLVNWGLPHNVVVREEISSEMKSPQNYETNITLYLRNKDDAAVIEDPSIGLVKTLKDKLSSVDPILKNINIKFNVKLV